MDFFKKSDDKVFGLSEELRYFVHSAEYGRDKSPLYQKFVDHISEGKAPSEFIRKNASGIFGEFINPKFEKHVYYTLDHLHEWMYQQGLGKRPLRTRDPHVIAEHSIAKIKEFGTDNFVDCDICDYIKKGLPEVEKYYKSFDSYDYRGSVIDIMAAEIDFGNDELMSLIKDSINGENDIPFERSFIYAIVKSHNRDMYEELGKLLKAAGLQEGLRQAICETMDSGTLEAFLYLFKVIVDNNFIRFSSVKRAIAVWLCFWNYDNSKIDRISNKMAEYVYDCLSDEKKRDEYLASEDSMKLHIALWSLGFYEARDLIDKIHDISAHGSKHQIMTAAYTMGILGNWRYYHIASKTMVEAHHDDLDIMVGCFKPFFLSRSGMWGKWDEGSIFEYFEDEDEAVKFYGYMRELYNIIPGKEITCDPYIFEWNKDSLAKSDVIIKMAYIAKKLENATMIDEICGMLKAADSYCRLWIIRDVLTNPTTAIQIDTIVAALGDKSDSIRAEAYKRAFNNKEKLAPKHYLQMEDMLRYKAADARENLIDLLSRRDDEAVLGTITRLLSDKKEEKRSAGLDMVITLSKKEDKKVLYGKCLQLAVNMKNPSTTEKLLLTNILPKMNEADDESSEEALYSDEDFYDPEQFGDELLEKHVKVFMDYFPDSELESFLTKGKLVGDGSDKKECDTYSQALKDVKAFDEFIKLHEKDEYTGRFGEKQVVGGDAWSFWLFDENEKRVAPLLELWEQYLEEHVPDEKRLLRMYILSTDYDWKHITNFHSKEAVNRVYGQGFSNKPECVYAEHIRFILESLLDKHVAKDDFQSLAIALAWFFVKGNSIDEQFIRSITTASHYNNGISDIKINRILGRINRMDEEDLQLIFPLFTRLYYIHREFKPKIRSLDDKASGNKFNNRGNYPKYMVLDPKVVIYATYKGILSKRQMYKILFEEDIADTLTFLSSAIKIIREKDRIVSSKVRDYWKQRVSKELEQHNEEGYLELIEEAYEKVLEKVLSVELKRGDSSTMYSKAIGKITRVYGVENFVAILSALGKIKLERSIFPDTETKKGALSRLLMVCVPGHDDNADKLKDLLKDTDITEERLVEAALYSPEWLEIVEQFLGWNGFVSGCYYFMAHMNDEFDDKKKAVIARYTPLSQEELNDGAFDIEWFKAAFKELGEKRFDTIYDAAKYITDGAKHSRARKYADAALGRYTPKELKSIVADKRNKDFLMAYPLIPLKNEDDIYERYQYLQQFLKESKSFGAQRIASESKAVAIAMQNLANNAGFSDVTRLTLRMETKLLEDSRDLFEDIEIEGAKLRLFVDEFGKTDIAVTKDGKALKSIPAKIKKDDKVKALLETKKKFTEQYRRTRLMFEQAMEDCTTFTAKELTLLADNPIVFPIIKTLLFMVDESGKLGFIREGKLYDYAGNETSLKEDELLRVAHSFNIYKDGHWSDYQKYVFDNGIIQPFKQIFRELYVKTSEELEMTDTRRYSGNQIQPKKTIACLKGRRWVPDIENGIQKVYYKENIVATIYAMADWFSPADIEAPTLEWVSFMDRKTWEPIKIKDIPDIIFSEVMRDVDLAVSVAHAGGVDPETSHSTIEMRAALAEFTLPLFKLTNVTIEKNHAHINGKYGNYSVHLGSGVVHKMGGTMINILPVHSQHRGKMFLPFADEDPKTAEIITKILFLAEDGKIKDPSILEQIR
ncbi:DUF4132 domain-containing protein [Butyrivibrio sp. MC2021]|uniref:DUF4132 domain-containing protein n=1 Tax=Butyrivibrio sp. MC2021 TaxID=1408306 RepID=UPI000684CAA1|nr:DUF4132 domain-containing protein [Butyrivibrio sp. MC2021]